MGIGVLHDKNLQAAVILVLIVFQVLTGLNLQNQENRFHEQFAFL
jgi:hypothetical protein